MPEKLQFTRFLAHKGFVVACSQGAQCIILAESKSDLKKVWAEMNMPEPLKLEHVHPAVLFIETELPKVS